MHASSVSSNKIALCHVLHEKELQMDDFIFLMLADCSNRVTADSCGYYVNLWRSLATLNCNPAKTS